MALRQDQLTIKEREDVTEMSPGWERAETADHVPYYISHVDGQTHWDHPDMTKLYEEMEGLNEVRYAAYRAALKLRAIQKLTHLSRVSLTTVQAMPLQNPQSTVTVLEMESVLVELFRQAKQKWNMAIDPNYCTELTLNWILSCFDSGRTGTIKLQHFNLSLIVLCSGPLEDKYRCMYDQHTEGHGSLAKQQLIGLIEDVTLIAVQLNEASAFQPGDADVAADSCLEFSSQRGYLKRGWVIKEQFVNWMMMEPKFIVWLPTLHRLALSETVKHEAKCAVCKKFPIVGLRYRSLKDLNTDFCQACYLSQKSAKNHKADHPVREYCLATTTVDDVRDFTKVFRNKLTKRHRSKQPKNSYLDYQNKEGIDEIDGPVAPLKIAHDRIAKLADRLAEGEEQDSAFEAVNNDDMRTMIEALEIEKSELLAQLQEARENRPATVYRSFNDQAVDHSMSVKLAPMDSATLRHTRLSTDGDTLENTSQAEMNAAKEVELAAVKEVGLAAVKEMEVSAAAQWVGGRTVDELMSSSASAGCSGEVLNVVNLSRVGSEQDDIDMLVRLMMESIPKDMEPCEVYLNEPLFRSILTVTTNGASVAGACVM